MKTKLLLLLLVSRGALGLAVAQENPIVDDPFGVAAGADPYVKDGSDVAGAEAPEAKLPPSNQVGVLVEYIQLDDRLANKMLRKHAGSLSAVPLRDELEAMLDAETAELVEFSYIKTRANQRAKVESIEEMIYPTEYDPPEIPQTVTLDDARAPGTAANPTAFEMRPVGTTVEVDPVISPDAKTIELNIAPEIVRFLGREYTVEDHEGLDMHDPKTLSSTIYQPKFHTMKNSTAVTVRDGDTVLLSIHRPGDAPEETMMVFLRADIVK